VKKLLLIAALLLCSIISYSQIQVEYTDSTFSEHYGMLVASEFGSGGSIDSTKTNLIHNCDFTVYFNVLIEDEVGTAFYNNQTKHLTSYLVYHKGGWKHYGNGYVEWLSCYASYYGFDRKDKPKKIGNVELKTDSEATMLIYFDNSFLIYCNE